MAKDTGKNTEPAAEPAAFTVHESVIISLARKAVEGIPGFIRFSGSSIVSDLADLVGSKRRFDKSIVVTESGSDVSLEILIVAAYGSKFGEVAAAVQKAVYDQIVDFTGMNVKSIDVVITDTEDAPEEESDDEDVVEGEVIQ
ncbi:MAG: Asp23/Gls24 family envelope stress response protein [Lentisphaeria bacterium]|nr:Asp23/Gls24 family envelope stress response protein [Lentisphaeria bacterium]